MRLGALDLYTDRPGDLRPEQFSDAVAMADIAADAILDLQADAAPGALASELDRGANLRSIVHQASGMVSVQLDVPVEDALAGCGRCVRGWTPIHDVARTSCAGSSDSNDEGSDDTGASVARCRPTSEVIDGGA